MTLLDHPRGGRVVELAARVRDHGALARELAHEHLARVADRGRIDVLERQRVGVDAGDVHPALVRERVLAHVGLVGVGREVEHLGDQVRGLGQPLQRRQAAVAHLQLQVRDDRDQVRVAAALAVAVHRALDHHGALGDPRQRVRDGALGVVVGVDPQRGMRQRPPHHVHRLRDLVRQRGAVGVAHRQVLGARVQRGAQTLDRVRGIVAVAVEEVLRVVDHALPARHQERDGLADHRQVLVAIDLDDLLEVQAPGLADDRRDRRPGLGQHAQRRVLLGRDPAPPGHPEGADVRPQPGFAQALEELELLRVRRREARLDHRHAELVEDPRDAHLLLDGQRHPLTLHPVAQGGVVDDDVRHAQVTAAGTLSSHFE